ncbi:MAG: CYTH domain-containing protein [Bacteroidales bacterium]|nr:CYTH domain-containing protein [Bacteroidales bacterium]
MMVEIERKFLVKGAFPALEYVHEPIKQGFLSTDPKRTVRVRIGGTRGYITVKGPGDPSGIMRFEWEHEITLQEATALLELCEPGAIYKTRYRIPAGKHVFEVDVFHGENQGLILAEIELQSPTDEFIRPEWLGDEVTGDIRYFNAYLARNPFTTWQ